ncbi:purine nucleoside phosphorylase [Paenibacillus sp. J31TS4]|uniref:purine-nucleoside phosphorylase n=1 Tax=Paenibacillus sp. J31TS4 TaxID=2807195 RepID=UPI001B2C34B8|nr:purine-nucleoside phosphorylase [Paenibacillus sp. J31TS4]GIP37553.1 purine nucleoside phosphorylase [Paenibacillus sp. J31TS4]
MSNQPSGKEAQQIAEAAEWIRQRVGMEPKIGLILGSGLGILAESLEDQTALPYDRIPHFPVSTVEGHAGELAVGKLDGRPVLMMKGRFHLYEGYEGAQVTFPIRVMKKLGIRTVAVTNSAGAVNTAYRPGEFMLIRDHLNLMGRSPLVGPNDPELGPRFPDMSEPYDRTLLRLGQETAERLGLRVHEGVYAGMLGPAYETPAEIRMLRTLGADAVGMSTVPEVIAARHAGLAVFGVSCLTNMAAGILEQPLSHEEVIGTTERVKADFVAFMREMAAQLPG